MDRDRDLHFVHVAGRKQRSDGPVDDSSHKDLLVATVSLSLVDAGRNSTECVRTRSVIILVLGLLSVSRDII